VEIQLCFLGTSPFCGIPTADRKYQIAEVSEMFSSSDPHGKQGSLDPAVANVVWKLNNEQGKFNWGGIGESTVISRSILDGYKLIL
jgi:hypothetical protein